MDLLEERVAAERQRAQQAALVALSSTGPLAAIAAVQQQSQRLIPTRSAWAERIGELSEPQLALSGYEVAGRYSMKKDGTSDPAGSAVSSFTSIMI